VQPMVRKPQPSCLEINQTSWTSDWISAVVTQGASSKDFSWRSQTCYQEIRGELSRSTEYHCSYCDSQPVLTAEIDHFESKMKHPQLAYEWTNLYACCTSCNKAKGESEPGEAIRPDEAGFTFNRFFLREFDGSIVPNPSATEADQARAATTIKFLKLNRHDLRNARKEHRSGALNPYRF
jgi:uncharacterized protein (TIGR02646 family)